MNSVPQDGDVIIHYYLPSGSRIELQIYFSRYEDPDEVIQSLFESENLTCTIIPDISRLVFDLFQHYRRTSPLQPLKLLIQPTINLSSSALTNGSSWKKYSLLFQSSESLKTLKICELELTRNTRKIIEKRKHLLLCEENRYKEAINNKIDTEKEHEQLVDEIEKDFMKNQQKVKNDFWIYVNSAEIPKKSDLALPLVNNDGLSVFKISLASQIDRIFTIWLKVSDDICTVPMLPNADTKDTEEVYLLHPENVYKRHITCLVLKYSASNPIKIVPELIRKSEETPELHFETIREQLSALDLKGDENIFTRHSNIKGIQGAFHIKDASRIAGVIAYANLHGVKQLVFPVYEWENVSPVSLISLIKAALMGCPFGDLEYVTLLVEEAEDLSDLVNAIKLVCAESVISIE